MHDLLDLERSLFFHELAEDDFGSADFDRVLAPCQEEFDSQRVPLEILNIEIVDLILKGELRGIVGLETLCKVPIARIMIVEIYGDEGLDGTG
jgi:hypothetical protein